MELVSTVLTSLMTPMVLCFILGIISTLVKSDLKFPEGLYLGLTIYLLFAIGLKGGYKLSTAEVSKVVLPGLGAIFMCVAIPVWCFFILHKLAKFSIVNAGAIAAHYGSVSAVTFSESLAFVELLKIPHEEYMPAMLAIMEVPAILIAILLVKLNLKESSMNTKELLHELFTGKGTVLLIGGLIIGLISGKKGFDQVAPLFDTPFRGVLALFLLEVGIVTGRRLPDLFQSGFRILGFGIIMPVIHAVIGIWIAKYTGLSLGGAVIFGTLCASASYIAAPAAIRIALPEASPAYYLTASLAITFPFNIVLGLPLYYNLAKYIYGV
jgi:hypothetical protein